MALLPACRVWFFETVITELQQWETQTGRKRKEKYRKNRTRAHSIQVNTGWKLKEEAKTFRGKKCFGFMVDQNLFQDYKVVSKFNVSQRLTKHEQIHRTVCLFTSASSMVCVPKWRVSKHQNQLTHKMIHMELLRKQVDKFIWTQIALDFCQSVKSLTLPRHYPRHILSFRL